MCPACITATALWIAGGVSASGVTVMAVKKLRKKQSGITPDCSLQTVHPIHRKAESVREHTRA